MLDLETSLDQTPEQDQLSAPDMKLNANAPEFEPLLPVRSKSSAKTKSTSTQPREVIISQSKLHPTNPDYSEQFYPFYTSFPSKGADFDTVQQWLRSWFDLQHEFDSDVGMKRYVGRILLNGEDVRTKHLVGPFLHVLNL